VERAKLNTAKRSYALVAEGVLLGFESLEREFSEKVSTFSLTFSEACEAFGRFNADLGAHALQELASFPRLEGQRAASMIIPSTPVLRPAALEFDIFAFKSWEKVFNPVFTVLRFAKGPVKGEWKEFVTVDKGDLLLVVEEGVRDLYVRNDNTGYFGLIAKTMVVDVANAGKKMVRKLKSDSEGAGVLKVKKDQYVILVAERPGGMGLCHTIMHELGLIPLALLKKP
jgi:hypothetical protein